MTDSKGRHARGWLFFDAECEFCTRLAVWLAGPMRRHGLAVEALQDPRVATLLGLSSEELKRSIHFLSPSGRQHLGADAMLAVGRELWWTQPLTLAAKLPGVLHAMRAGYCWVARMRRCPAQHHHPESSCWRHAV